MHQRVRKITQSFLISLTLIALLFSLYMQYVQGLEPCPLCAMQRLCVLGLLVTALWALGVQGRVFRSLVRAQLVFALLGLYFAARQLWLQSLPVEHTGVCLPGLKLLAQYMPWRDLVPLLFLGSPACNEILWQAWGFSMAAWSALFFAVEGGGLLWLLWA